ncbi:hypothetical protein [Curtobacterium sp. 24E2]
MTKRSGLSDLSDTELGAQPGLDARCSMLDARCSMLDARCSMLDRWIAATCRSVAVGVRSVRYVWSAASTVLGIAGSSDINDVIAVAAFDTAASEAAGENVGWLRHEVLCVRSVGERPEQLAECCGVDQLRVDQPCTACLFLDREVLVAGG